MSSGSQKRKTTAQIKVNCTPEQKAAIIGKANDAGYSPAAFCLNALLKTPLPPRSRPTLDDQAISLLSREMGNISGLLGKAGSNLNQLTKYANMDRWLANLIAEAIQENKAAQRELLEWRTAFMHATGAERNRKPKDK